MNFDYLKELDVKDKTAEFPLSMIRNCPVLIVRPATEANPPYFNEILRRSSKTIRNAAQGKIQITSDTMKKNRKEDRELFPKHVIVGWNGVIDSEGNEGEFNEENCSKFVNALPDWIFDQIGAFCRNNSNFLPDNVDQEDMDSLAKN